MVLEDFIKGKRKRRKKSQLKISLPQQLEWEHQLLSCPNLSQRKSPPKMKRKRNNSGQNTKIAIAFFVFIFLIIAGSAVYKLSVLISKSRFDDNKRFTVFLSNNKESQILSFSPDEQRSIVVLKVEKNIRDVDDAAYFLAIPIDGEISGNFDLGKDITGIMSKALLSIRDIKTDLTAVDIFRAFLSSRTVPKNYVYFRKISSSLTAAEVDKIVAQIFSESNIRKDNETIEIINATDATGFGSRVARLITNIGGNVVIVKTADKVETQSQIFYSKKKNYTVGRLSEILGIPAIQKDKKTTIADITVVIGRQSLRHRLLR